MRKASGDMHSLGQHQPQPSLGGHSRPPRHPRDVIFDPCFAGVTFYRTKMKEDTHENIIKSLLFYFNIQEQCVLSTRPTVPAHAVWV